MDLDLSNIDSFNNFHAHRKRSFRKDSARILVKDLPTPENIDINNCGRDRTRRSTGSIETSLKPIIQKKNNNDCEDIVIKEKNIEEDIFGNLRTNQLNLSRNISSPQLSNKIQKKENTNSYNKVEKVNTDIPAIPIRKKRKRRLSQSISSHILINIPFSNPLTPRKDKTKSKIKTKENLYKEKNPDIISPKRISRKLFLSDTLSSDSNVSGEFEYDPFAPETSNKFNIAKLSPITQSPVIQRNHSVTPFKRESGIRFEEAKYSNESYKLQLSEEHTKRYRIIQELRDTERSFVTSLHMIIVIFIIPIRNKINTPQQILSEKELKEIFGNIEDICHFSQKLLEQLEVKIHPSIWNNESTIGDLFNDLLDQDDMSIIYHEYVDTYDKALITIRSAFRDENSPFGIFAKSCQSLCDNHSLSSLLVSPVQRVPRYQLLLEDLVKATPINHKDKRELLVAHKKMVQLATSLNEKSFREESQKKLQEISLKFKKCFHSDLNVKGRELLVQGEILQNDKECKTLFLFNDLLVCADNSKLSKPLKVLWKVRLKICTVNFIEYDKDNAYIQIFECKLIKESPYITKKQYIIYPSVAPYDYSFWKNSFINALKTFQWDKDRLLVEYTTYITNHMRKYLIGERERTILQIGTEKLSFKLNESICGFNGNADALYFVNYGQIRVEKLIANKWTTIKTLQKDDYFGEYSYLVGGNIIQEKYPIRFTALTNTSIVSRIPFGQLNYVFFRNPSLALNFFKLQSFILGHLFIIQSLMIYKANQPKSYLHFIQQLNRYLNKKENKSSILLDSDDSTSESKSKKGRANLLSKLKLGPTEVILAHYPCKLKKDVRSAILFILNKYILVANSFLGYLSNQTKIYFDNIKNFRLVTDHCLEIQTNERNPISIQFNSPPQVSEVLHLLSVLVEQTQYCEKDIINSPIDNDVHNDIFMELTNNEWDTIYQFATILEYKKGDIVLNQDSIESCLFKTLSGKFALERNTISQLDTKESSVLLGKAKENSIFGSVGFIFGISMVNVTVLSENASCYKFTKDKIQELIIRYPILGAKLYRTIDYNILRKILKQQKFFVDLQQK